MIEDDNTTAQPRGQLTPALLDPLGVSELRAYIAELRMEIDRAEAEIARKDGHRSAADAFFKLPPVHG